ncbi:MAG: hypothetical protein ACFB3T_11665 [Geminicoccaceae bacterium]
MPRLPLVLIALTLLATTACDPVDQVKAQAKDVIAYYCQAGDAERAALRAQLSTSKGPLVTINCENLL